MDRRSFLKSTAALRSTVLLSSDAAIPPTPQDIIEFDPSVGGWHTRNLNTVRENTTAGASIASNQITIPAGTYRIVYKLNSIREIHRLPYAAFAV